MLKCNGFSSRVVGYRKNGKWMGKGKGRCADNGGKDVVIEWGRERERERKKKNRLGK